jgi:UDP-2-acetamido-2-deoxy-ribo-hexuluronate aminotransferase
MEFIDLKEQYRRHQAAIDARLHQVLNHGHFIMGPEIAELEQALAAYVGVRHCLTVASGTDSLEIALRALDIGAGDEVITVPFTWISTAEAIALTGAKPVFVDIDAATYNINISQIEAAITPRTKAIMPVSLFGQMPDCDRINAIAAKHGLAVIEDGAQSFGATRNGRRSCGVTTIGSTSFFPAKPLGCYGDGGALFTNDDALAEKMKAIRTHGGVKRHHHTLLGMNGRFDTLQAAVLLAKFPHFEWEVRERNRIGARYSALLSSVCTTPAIEAGNTHVYAQYTIRTANRDQVGEQLKARGIPSAVYYPKCLHEQPIFAGLGYKLGDFPESEKASREVISLPMHPFLTEADQDKVAAALKEIVSGKSSRIAEVAFV